MPARSVLFVPKTTYHIYNRGSEKRTIFLNSRDYTKFLDRLKENCEKYTIDILAFCLMPNHFHLLLSQTTDASIQSCMQALQLGHAKFFNTKYTRVGPLFQGRFKAKPVETDEYLLEVSAYIHRNIIAHLIDSGNPKDSRNLALSTLKNYPYSSYRDYIGLYSNTYVQKETILSYFSKTNPKLSYQSFVENFVPDIEALVPLLASA